MHKCFCVYILVQISENMLVIHILSILACFVSHYKFFIKSHISIVSKPLANPNHKDIASVGPDIPISGPNTFSGSGHRARTRSIVRVRTRWIDYICIVGCLFLVCSSIQPHSKFRRGPYQDFLDDARVGDLHSCFGIIPYFQKKYAKDVIPPRRSLSSPDI